MASIVGNESRIVASLEWRSFTESLSEHRWEFCRLLKQKLGELTYR